MDEVILKHVDKYIRLIDILELYGHMCIVKFGKTLVVRQQIILAGDGYKCEAVARRLLQKIWYYLPFIS